ncbi:MAG: hypothetical protein ACYCRH_02890 [Acidiferrobacteraceae bacterium]
MEIKNIIAAGAIALFSTSAWGASMSMGGGSMGAKQHCTHYKTMGHETGVHQMSGTVTAINHRTGILSLKTAEGTLRLHFPPPSLRQVKRGERMDVHLGFTLLH